MFGPLLSPSPGYKPLLQAIKPRVSVLSEVTERSTITHKVEVVVGVGALDQRLQEAELQGKHGGAGAVRGWGVWGGRGGGGGEVCLRHLMTQAGGEEISALTFNQITLPSEMYIKVYLTGSLM